MPIKHTEVAYEFGRSWNVLTPRRAIKSVASRTHVDDHQGLLNKIEKAIATSPDKSKYTADIINECMIYAAICMKRNQRLLRLVMVGRL